MLLEKCYKKHSDEALIFKENYAAQLQTAL